MGRKKKHKNPATKDAVQPDIKPVASPKKSRIGLVVLLSASLLFVGAVAYTLLLDDDDTPIKKPVIQRLPFPTFPDSVYNSPISYADFVGSEACAPCHSDVYKVWKESTHGKAGGSPSPHVVIGDFDGKPRRFKNATFTPFRASNGDFKFRLAIDDMTPQEFTIDAVVGGGHLLGGGTQTYFSKFPDGTYKFLPFDFIRDEGVWFAETKGNQGWIPISEDLPITELSEWPPSRILGAHMSIQNCQQCHGSQIEAEFKNDQQKFQTNIKSLSINCESCHGPGKRHIDIMKSPDSEQATDIGMVALETLSKDESLQTCFSCHALKDVLEPGYLPGKDLEQFYSLLLPMVGESPFHDDGRIKAFGYQQNHLFSDCYISGSMTCVSCHDPHSQGYRDINSRPLSGAFDEKQCASCHASKAVEPELHSFHLPDSPGNNCVSCHMPYLQHKAMGKVLRFGRSDHTIAIPRPAFDSSIGIENGCIQCHSDMSVEDLQNSVNEWYGEIKPHEEAVAHQIKFQEGFNVTEAGALLLTDSSFHTAAQMAGLAKFSKYLRPDGSINSTQVEKIKKFVESPDVDLKSMAMASLHLTADNDNSVHNYLVEQLDNLNEVDESKVRKRWSLILPQLGENMALNGNPQGAIATYKKALEISPTNTKVLINLGLLYEALGEFDNAVKAYTDALKIDENDIDGWVNLGNTFQKKGDVAKAVLAYKEAVKINPWDVKGHFNLGNHYYRTDENVLAIQSYQKALDINPGLIDGYFNLARAFIKNRQYGSAMKSVKAGLTLDPDNELGLQILAALTPNSEAP
ncbi:MAG: tetratricopeptide repeat protein [Cyclobacteriaceae bacterium]